MASISNLSKLFTLVALGFEIRALSSDGFGLFVGTTQLSGWNVHDVAGAEAATAAAVKAADRWITA